MIATIINSLGVLLGSILGLVFAKHISEKFRTVIFAAAGIMSMVIGILMAIKTERILFLSLSLVLGGIAGTALGIEDRIKGLGERIKLLVPKSAGGGNFAEGFLESSVLFCVGAMAIIGSIQAGTQGDYSLLLTKTVMDTFIAILLAAALGLGVAFSAVSILAYQGALTLMSGFIAPHMTQVMTSSINGTGGAIVMMIGLNLLGLTKIPTGNFIMALVLAVVFAIIDPGLPAFLRM